MPDALSRQKSPHYYGNHCNRFWANKLEVYKWQGFQHKSIRIFLMATRTSTLITASMMDSDSEVTNFAFLLLRFENMLFVNCIQEGVVVIWDMTRHSLSWMIIFIGHAWELMLSAYVKDVAAVNRLKVTRRTQVYISHCLFLIHHGKISAWILC